MNTAAPAERSSRFPLGAAVSLDDLTHDLHTVTALLRRSEPVTWLAAINGWYVTDYELALRILRDPERFTVDDERFTTGQVVGPSMLSTDGDAHRHHRGPFERGFRSTAVVAAEETVRALADELVLGLKPRGEGELREELAAPLAVAVICRFLGLDRVSLGHERAVEQELLGWYRQIVDAVTGLSTGREIPGGAIAAVEQMGLLVTEAAGGDRGLLRQVASGGRLSEAELRSNTAVILFGAIETCEGMTGNALFHVLSLPWLQRAVVSRSVDLERVVAESLRLEPAAAVVDRFATADTEVGGVRIPAGDLVTVSLAGANRDPAVFTDPDTFNPDRPGVGHHLAFARGPHVCLGLHLAKLQTRVALRRFFSHLPQAKLVHEQAQPPQGLIFRKPRELTAGWEP